MTSLRSDYPFKNLHPDHTKAYPKADDSYFEKTLYRYNSLKKSHHLDTDFLSFIFIRDILTSSFELFYDSTALDQVRFFSLADH